MLPQYLFLLAAQLINLVYQSYAMRRLRSLARQEQLMQARRPASRPPCRRAFSAAACERPSLRLPAGAPLPLAAPIGCPISLGSA